MEESRPLDLGPDAVNELDEDAWYERVYRGDDAPQLTPRAVAMGAALGFFLAITNLYLGLKIGWHIGVALTACILSFSIWTAIHKVGTRQDADDDPREQLHGVDRLGGRLRDRQRPDGPSIPALLLLSVTPENPGGTAAASAL